MPAASVSFAGNLTDDPGTADSGIVPTTRVCEAAAVNHVTTTLGGVRCDDGLPACCWAC